MFSVPEVMARSGYTEEDIFDWGISGEITFLVVVPELGACRVPAVALSHFMAGADEYTAERMPEHWSKTPSGRWTIRRDRLRIHEESWHRFSDKCRRLGDAAATVEPHETTVPTVADKPTPSLPSWKMLVQAEATEHWIRVLATGGQPSVHSIAEPLADWCKANNIRTTTKVNPGERYLRQSVLSGRYWTPPNLTREQAKKHVAQLAQVAQAAVAQAAQK